jgi:predicted AAA+ superfamily ATPase
LISATGKRRSPGGIRGERKIRDLVRLPAFQTGSEVSYTEPGTSLGMSKDTVIRYVDLLEKPSSCSGFRDIRAT